MSRLIDECMADAKALYEHGLIDDEQYELMVKLYEENKKDEENDKTV